MASEGTSLEDIESGAVAHTADDAVMNAILSDMNAIEEPTYRDVPSYTPPDPQPPVMPMMHGMSGMPPMHGMSGMPPMQQQMYYPMEQPSFQAPPPPTVTYEPVADSQIQQGLKKNSWSTLFDQMRDPLVVGLLVCLFSLPALHTALSKRLPWAYQVGGSLSWIGFLLLFVLVAGIYATYRQIILVSAL